MRIKLGLVLSVAAFTVGCFGAKMLPTQEPRAVSPLQFAADEWRVPSQAIVLSDMSGTTYVEKTHPYIKAFTQSFVKAMPEGNTRAKYPGNYDATLIGFGGDERIISPLAPFSRGALAAKADMLRLLGDLKGYGGETPIEDVLYEVSDALTSKSGRAAVVLFSDGLPEPENQMRAMEAGTALVERYNGEVCIHTVHFGENEQGAMFLKKLSELTQCGSNRSLSDVWGADNLMKFAHTVFAGPAEEATCGKIVLRGIEFEFNKSVITADSTAILDFAVDELNKDECRGIPVKIVGHTDLRGSDAYNMALGKRRADAVGRYFVSKGVKSGRLSASSRGERDVSPPRDSDDDDKRQRDRRVELIPQQ